MNQFIHQQYTENDIAVLSKKGVETITTSTPINALRALFLNLDIRLVPFQSFEDIETQLHHVSYLLHTEAVRIYGRNVITNYDQVFQVIDSFTFITTPNEQLCIEKWAECVTLLTRVRSDFYHVLSVSIADSLVRSSPMTTEILSKLVEGPEYNTLVEEYMLLTTNAVLKKLYV